MSPELDPAATLQIHNGIAVITLNRPRALNAVNGALATAVGEHLESAERDDSVKVIVLTGAGRAFCAGADLKAIAAGENIDAPGHPEWGFGGYTQHWVSKPTVAAVNGLALGGGTELILASDLSVADENAVLGLPEVTRGQLAGAGGVIRLQQQIPRKFALELALTGKQISAQRAAALGLVNDVVPKGTSLDAALSLAALIAGNAPLSVQESKAMIHRTATCADWGDEAWAYNAASMKIVRGSADAAEGATAFAERRAPQWRGR